MIMKAHQDILVGNILYSCIDRKQRGNEQFVQAHSIGYIVSGEVHFETMNGAVIYKEGTMGLVRKNQLIRSLKVPPPDGEFKAINIFLDQEILRKYSADHHIQPTGRYTGESMQLLSDDPVMEGFFKSLLPYFESPESLTESLIRLKTHEAIELLLQRNLLWKDLLFDFSEPHKIDIERFMNDNYKFNVSTAQFAQLSGRSIAGFKRDFEKTFQTTPGKWLHKKRLDEAYFLIKQKGLKPSEVYLNVGFENLSHFSYAFKKNYGIAPSLVWLKD